MIAVGDEEDEAEDEEKEKEQEQMTTDIESNNT